MIPTATSLTMLQLSDSGFPSGALSFSSGVERLSADGLLTQEEDVFDLLRSLLLGRWNTFDRIFVLRALDARDADAWQDLDRQVEMQTLSAAGRAASRRSGQALLGAWARIGNADVQGYQDRVRAGSARGHQCVVQGLVYASAGLTPEAAELASCWSAMTGVVSAAVRLDLIGHLAGQRLLTRAVPLVADALATPVAPDASPSGWSPLVDIAVARHQLFPSRQFAS